MATFTVNGQTVTVEKNQKLIRYLRDQLHLTSVKDGCSEGACGTCHVLIDGKPTKACIPQTDKLEGKTIVTVEGLTDWEKQVYTFAFGEAGAVQCGFCIPGMVISAKTPGEHLPEMMELPNHPFFFAVQFHPEFTSNPRFGHPLFKAYIEAAIAHADEKKAQA